MSNTRIHRIYGIVLSIFSVIAGICLIAACISIYRNGDQPYSPESVAAAFATIAVPVYICLVLVVGGFILNALYPAPAEKAKPEKQYAALLAKRYSAMGADAKNNTFRRKRMMHSYISLGLLALGSIVFLCYGMNGANFDTRDINGSMVKAMYVLLPCMAVPFGYGVFTAYYTKSIMRKELEHLKQLSADTQKAVPSKVSSEKAITMIRWGLLAAGLMLFLYGFCAAGTDDVLTKAINICTECVGLG